VCPYLDLSPSPNTHITAQLCSLLHVSGDEEVAEEVGEAAGDEEGEMGASAEGDEGDEGDE